MSDTPENPGNVVQLAAAFDTAEKRKRKKDEKKPDAKKGGGFGGGGAAPPAPGIPERLPPDCPVVPLGTMDGMYFYLDALGQLRRNKQSEHGRLHILDLFGGHDYLCAIWPIWELTGTGWQKKRDFKHSVLAPAMMASCREKGVWDPTDRVRGCGTWVEDNGDLVMHCGLHLWRSVNGTVMREEAGVKGDMLYPRRATLPEPDFTGEAEPGPRTLDMLSTWNFKRGETDQLIFLGWLVCAVLGQAPSWRPMMWVTGGKGSGKSTLRELAELILGDRAHLKPSNTSQAFIYQTLGDGALPVLLDEFEAKEDNKRIQDVIELMRIAASGGELGRGGSENNPKTYTLKSCFAAFSILMPPLSPQDRSRMAVLELRPLHKADDEAALDLSAPDDHDLVLGSKEKWRQTGRQLRGRVMKQWPRYRKTFRAYVHALLNEGHEHRAASQFGALGAGQDIALYDDAGGIGARAQAWAKRLPSASLSESKGYQSEPEACLQHLLSATPEAIRHGTKETIAHYLRQARSDIEKDVRNNEPDDACRILAKTGIRIYRDAERVTGDDLKPVWWVAVSSTHSALFEIFKGTHWKGKAGAPGTWAQALRGLEGAGERAIQMRIDGAKHWVTPLLWDAVLPGFDRQGDAEEISAVNVLDRNKVKGEV